MLDDQLHLHTQLPEDAAGWHVCVIFLPDHSSIPGRQGLQPEADIFHTPADLETYFQYHPDPAAVAYTFEDALYLSECLIRTYRQILSD
jgi:hypothetical protein